VAASTPAKTGGLVLFEYGYLVLLWMLFVSNPSRGEFYAGAAVALAGTIADWVVKRQEFAKFRPRLAQLALVLWEPWYALTGTAAILKALARKLLGKPSEARFRAVAIDAGGDDAESHARRALLVAYITLTPMSIVVGIDCDQKKMLVHEISPTPTPRIAKKLGALE
jgi:Multisubunit Na+/H+ antiporter, MnhE subunit